MTPEQLKASILQAAIQGKLVAQISEEGSAEDIIDQIKEEKQKRIKAGLIKKEKALPKITDDITPFDVPDTWKWVYSRDVIRFINGRAYKKPELLDSGKYPVLRVGNFFTNDSWYYSDLELEEDKYCQKGDLLYAWSASFGPKIWDGEKVIFHYHIWKLDFFSPMNIKYLYYYLLADTMRIKNSSHGLGFVFVTKEFMEGRLLPVPPMEEQQRIVDKIEELLPYIDRYAGAYEKLEHFNAKFPEDMKKSILQYAIQGKLVEHRPEEGTAEDLLQEIGEVYCNAVKTGKLKKIKPIEAIKEEDFPFDIPETWKWVYVNDIAFVTKLAGFEYTKFMAGAITNEGEVPIVRAKNIKPNNFMENEEEFISLELSEQLQRCALDEPCVLMTFIGAGIGEVAVFENKRRNHLAPNVAKIVPHIDMNKYMLYYFMSPTGQQEIFKFMKAVAQPSLSMDTIRQVKIPIPPLEEQHRIVKKVEELLPYCEKLIY